MPPGTGSAPRPARRAPRARFERAEMRAVTMVARYGRLCTPSITIHKRHRRILEAAVEAHGDHRHQQQRQQHRLLPHHPQHLAEIGRVGAFGRAQERLARGQQVRSTPPCPPYGSSDRPAIEATMAPLQPRAHLGRIEQQGLDQLGGEQRHGRRRQGRHRHVDIARQHPHHHGPDDRHDGHHHAQAVGNPGQPAGQELIALRPGQGRAADENRPGMALEHLHGAIDPAIALGHEGLQRVGHQARAHALRHIGGLIAGLEQLEAQFGVLGDAPFAPAIHFLQRVFARRWSWCRAG